MCCNFIENEINDVNITETKVPFYRHICRQTNKKLNVNECKESICVNVWMCTKRHKQTSIRK